MTEHAALSGLDNARESTTNAFNNPSAIFEDAYYQNNDNKALMDNAGKTSGTISDMLPEIEIGSPLNQDQSNDAIGKALDEALYRLDEAEPYEIEEPPYEPECELPPPPCEIETEWTEDESIDDNDEQVHDESEPGCIIEEPLPMPSFPPLEPTFPSPNLPLEEKPGEPEGGIDFKIDPRNFTNV